MVGVGRGRVVIGGDGIGAVAGLVIALGKGASPGEEGGLGDGVFGEKERTVRPLRRHSRSSRRQNRSLPRSR